MLHLDLFKDINLFLNYLVEYVYLNYLDLINDIIMTHMPVSIVDVKIVPELFFFFLLW